MGAPPFANESNAGDVKGESLRDLGAELLSPVSGRLCLGSPMGEPAFERLAYHDLRRLSVSESSDTKRKTYSRECSADLE